MWAVVLPSTYTFRRIISLPAATLYVLSIIRALLTELYVDLVNNKNVNYPSKAAS